LCGAGEDFSTSSAALARIVESYIVRLRYRYQISKGFVVLEEKKAVQKIKTHENEPVDPNLKD